MKYISEDKLNKIKLLKNNFYLAIDFDRTITSKESCGSWDVCRDVLGKEFERENLELYLKYAPIEQDYSISFEEKNKAMEEWYYGNFNLYNKYKLTAKMLKESVDKSSFIFRKGAEKFLYEMYKNNVPVVVLSAGIGNAIVEFLKKNNCLYDNMHVISNFLSFDEAGNIKQYDGELIHTMNKTMKGKIESSLQEKIKEKEYRLLVGDFIEDKTIVPTEDWEKTIFVGFLDKEVEKNLEVYTNNFDIVLTEGDASFDNVANIIEF